MIREWLKSLGIDSICQWDLLVFLHSHRTLLVGAEDIARLMPYGTAPVVAALDRLESRGLLERSRLSQGVRLYQLAQIAGPRDRAFRELLSLAASENKIERLLIDGMSSYSTALRDQQLYRDFFHALIGFAKHRLITVFLNYEYPELFGLTHFMPEFAVSSIVDNIILTNFVELGNTLHRAITLAKARGSNHEFVTREFAIGQGGLSLLPADQTQAIPVLPFQSYYGLLSRAPTRYSPRIPHEPTLKGPTDEAPR